MIKLSELQRLDKFSLAEVEKIIEDYEKNRMWLAVLINKKGEDAYKNSDTYRAVKNDVIRILKNDSTVPKVLAVLEQLKAENIGRVSAT